MGTPTGDHLPLFRHHRGHVPGVAGYVNKNIIHLKEYSEFGRACCVVNVLCQSNNKAIILKFICKILLIKKFSRNHFWRKDLPESHHLGEEGFQMTFSQNKWQFSLSSFETENTLLYYNVREPSVFLFWILSISCKTNKL